jgi:uncharacterized protein YceK
VAKRVQWSLYLVALAVSPCGCGTFCNDVWFTPGEGGKRVYGGVRVDCQVAREALNEHRASGDFWGTLLYSALDLPLSAVGDTLSLPYTVPCALWRLGHPEPQRRLPETAGPAVPAVVNAREEKAR